MKISDNSIGRISEVLDNNGKIVATGRIVDVNDKHIKIESVVGEMSLLELNSIVKLRVYGNNKEFQTFDSRVKQSSRSGLYLSDGELLSNEEKREFFRVSVNLHTKAYPHKQLDEDKAFKVKVRDLSIRGCFVATDIELHQGDKINLVLPLLRTEVYDCTVMRKVENDKGVGYGCSFDKFTSRQEDLICEFIFEEQRKMISKTKR